MIIEGFNGKSKLFQLLKGSRKKVLFLSGPAIKRGGGFFAASLIHIEKNLLFTVRPSITSELSGYMKNSFRQNIFNLCLSLIIYLYAHFLNYQKSSAYVYFCSWNIFLLLYGFLNDIDMKKANR